MDKFSQLLEEIHALHLAETASLQREIDGLRMQIEEHRNAGSPGTGESGEQGPGAGILSEGKSHRTSRAGNSVSVRRRRKHAAQEAEHAAESSKNETQVGEHILEKAVPEEGSRESGCGDHGSDTYMEDGAEAAMAISSKDLEGITPLIDAEGSKMHHDEVPKPVTERPPSQVLKKSNTMKEKKALPFRTPSPEDKKQRILEEKGQLMGNLNLIVTGPYFESFFAFCIFMNALVMAAEVQYVSIDTHKNIGLGSEGASDAWPGMFTTFEVFGYIFGVLFTFEIAFKIAALHMEFFWDAWNWIDSVIVLIWIIGKAQAGFLPLNSQIFRLFRLLRLVRLVRLVRTIQSFDALYLMTTALRGSVSVLTWAAALLFVIQLLLALLFTQLLTEYYFNDTSIPVDGRVAVYEYFGSFTRSLLTMFELTLGNWIVPCRVLMQNVNEWFMVLIVMHKLVVGFAVIGVVNGVFMQETFKVASTDDRIMLRQKQTAMSVHERKMRSLFEAVDTENRGYINFQQFQRVMSEPQVKTWLASMELSTDDIDKLYGLLDDGDEQLSCEELIKGVARLKGPARSIDLAVLMQQQVGVMAVLQQAGS